MVRGTGWTAVLTTVDGEGMTSLQNTEGSFRPSAELTVLAVDETVQQNGMQAVALQIENTGAANLSDLICELTLNGQTVSQVMLDGKLNIGDARKDTPVFEIPALTELTNFDVVLMTSDGTVLDIQTIQLGRTDLSMDIRQRDMGDKVLLEVHISNLSETPSDVAFTVNDGISGGMVLYIEHMTQVTNEESYTFLYTFHKDEIDYNEKGMKY